MGVILDVLAPESIELLSFGPLSLGCGVTLGRFPCGLGSGFFCFSPFPTPNVSQRLGIYGLLARSNARLVYTVQVVACPAFKQCRRPVMGNELLLAAFIADHFPAGSTCLIATYKTSDTKIADLKTA
jgi:hypothetical protein